MFSLESGKTYELRLTVKNTSTQGGVAVAATLNVGISAAAGGTVLISSQESPQQFSAGQSRVFSYNLYIPSSVSGSGTITAWVKDPAGNTLASGSENVVVEAPGASPFNMSISSIVRGGIGLGGLIGYDVNCLISNPNSQVVSHNLSLYVVWAGQTTNPADPATYTGTRWWTYNVFSLPVTLNPGASVGVVSLKIDMNAWNSDLGQWGVSNSPNEVTHNGAPYKWYFMIVDELGNHSAPASVGNYEG
jgi:hypothetical protein